MSKAQAAATSNRKSSFSAAALVTTKDTLTFRLHPKQLVAFRCRSVGLGDRSTAGVDGDRLLISRSRRPPRARNLLARDSLSHAAPIVMRWTCALVQRSSVERRRGANSRSLR